MPELQARRSAGPASSFRSIRRTAIGALLAAASLVILVAPAAAEEITVQGNRAVGSDAIRSHFHAAPGGVLDAAALDAALKELYATGAFEDVRIARSSSGVTVTVVEARMIERVAFEGNHKLKDEDLRKATQLKPRDFLTRAAVQSDVARIAELYHRGGRYLAEVRPKTIPRGDGRVDLVFEIDEGAKTGIKHIVFVGNRSFPDQRLKANITTGESGWLALFKNNDIYDPDRVESDRDQLRRFYLRNGFVDARVISAVASYDPQLRGIALTFTLDEGERYRLGTVALESRVASIDPAPLRPLVQLAPGDVLDGEAVRRAGDELALAAARQGQPFVIADARLKRNVGARTIDLTFVLNEQARRYVERIVVRGNKSTRDVVVRRELDFGEGDALNRALVARAERRIKALGLFKSVRIATERGSAPDRVVLNIEVEEQRTGDFSIAGGYSTVDGMVASVSVSEQNLLGRGQYVKVAATIGPYILGTRAALGVDLSYNESLTNPNQSYGSTSYGASTRLIAPINDSTTGDLHYSIVRQSTSLNSALMDCSPAFPPPACFANGEASAAVKQSVLDGPTYVSAIGSTIAHNGLDNPRDPHNGLRTQVTQDIAGIGGGADFLRSTAEARYYKSFGDDLVAMVRLSGGNITPYGGQTLPLASSFFGGPQLVRGFAPKGFGPRDITPGTTMDNIGGSTYWASTLQLQAPVPGLPPEAGLKVAAFADSGSLWGYRGQTAFPTSSQGFTPVDSRAVRASVGTSLIWDSPFGPLHVDYAYPISKNKYDVTQRLGFGAGPF
jgi:outer membrane protein insertion porin family